MITRFFRPALAALTFLVGAAYAQTPGPAVFYSDLESGPKTGGENNNGAFVTIWGNNFGASQGTSSVSIGGGRAAAYKVWTNTKITFQLGTNANTGNVTVTTGAGTSNGIPFTVRAGNIYFVTTSGNDSNNGSFASPWRTATRGVSGLAAGDIVYLGNGITATSVHNYNAAVWLGDSGSGTAAAPKALIAYPGATATIGTISGTPMGLRGSDYRAANNYWVISGLTLRAANAAIELGGTDNWKIVGNDIACPNGSGQSACVHTDSVNYLKFWGNYVHDVGNTAGSIDKYYHAVYFTTNSNNIDVGWNTIVPNPTQSRTSGGCRAIQFYSTGGSDQYGLVVHDNLIHDAICDGINFATVNPDLGVVQAYNNVVYRVGTGPDPVNGSSNYACVNVGSSASRSNTMELFNNTLVDCGSRGTSDAGAISTGLKTRMRNNIIRQNSGENYFSGSCSSVTGSNNLWYGAGTAPACGGLTGNISSDAAFVDLTAKNLKLALNSPAKDAGINTGLAMDAAGVARPQGSQFDIGAYEYFAGDAAPAGNPCDLTGDNAVDFAADVKSAKDQALNIVPCTNADLNRDGACNVVDVQRVINAALGQTCRVDP